MPVTETLTKPSVVLVIAGHDPTGGAGIQADAEALASQGCYAATVVTALTVQDTKDVHDFHTTDPDIVTEQALAILNDLPVAAVKIGMLGSKKNVRAVRNILDKHPDLPVVLDPVLRAGGGTALAQQALIEAISELLLPVTLLTTPNSLEARQLCPNAETLEACADQLLSKGCQAVLITGSHEAGQEITHTLYRSSGQQTRYHCSRLPAEFHGSGCTLASAIAGGIAQGEPVENAVARAQEYTLNSLRKAFSLGAGQRLPNRLFWRSPRTDGSHD